MTEHHEYQPDRRSVGRRVVDKELEMRVHTLETEVKLLREMTEKGTAATAKVLEIVTMAEGFFKTLGYLGAAAKWTAGVVAAGAALWAAWRGVPYLPGKD